MKLLRKSIRIKVSVNFKCNRSIKWRTVLTCLFLEDVLHFETQRHGICLEPQAQPHGQADLERSLMTSPSPAPALVRVQVGFPSRPWHIPPSSSAALGSSWAVSGVPRRRLSHCLALSGICGPMWCCSHAVLPELWRKWQLTQA